METEDVGNITLVNTDATPDLAELDRDFAQLIEDLDLDEGEDSPEFKELDAAIAGTEFAAGGAESGGALSLLDIADGVGGVGGAESEPEFFKKIRNLVKRRASKLINKLVALVRRYRKYASCVPAVTKAVVAFKAGKWGTAVKLALSAYRCIRAKR